MPEMSARASFGDILSLPSCPCACQMFLMSPCTLAASSTVAPLLANSSRHAASGRVMSVMSKGSLTLSYSFSRRSPSLARDSLMRASVAIGSFATSPSLCFWATAKKDSALAPILCLSPVSAFSASLASNAGPSGTGSAGVGIHRSLILSISFCVLAAAACDSRAGLATSAILRASSLSTMGCALAWPNFCCRAAVTPASRSSSFALSASNNLVAVSRSPFLSAASISGFARIIFKTSGRS